MSLAFVDTTVAHTNRAPYVAKLCSDYGWHGSKPPVIHAVDPTMAFVWRAGGGLF